ncbi:hypothetical protein [Chitinophaga sp.]|uniref:hypothetical protein n=1 Tax=Chitinophaga sp. TaxID=1869181 RepID=UPI0031DDF907
MGNFLFEIRSSKWLGILYAIISFLVALVAAVYLISAWSSLGIIGKIVTSLIVLGAGYYGYDRINVIGHNKIRFYEKGIEVHTKGDVETLLLEDVASMSWNNINSTFTYKFIRHNGSVLSLDADDFSMLASNLEHYGKQVNFDIRTNL